MNKRLKEIEARAAAIVEELKAEGADVDALNAEITSLYDERAELLEVEARNKKLHSMAKGSGQSINKFDDTDEDEKRYDESSPEYRTAYFKNIMDRADEMTIEERDAFIHTTANTPAVLPTETLNEIWNLVGQQHSIMSDIRIIHSGVAIEIVKHTAIVQGKATKVSEATANDDEQNTFVKVKLSGNDISKHIDVSYALGRMSIQAFESYLIAEIAESIGEALADDVIAQIKTDIANDNKVPVTTGAVAFTDVAKAFGQLKRTSAIYVYVNNYTLYNQLVSLVDDNKRPIFQQTAQEGAKGALLGGTIRLEESLGNNEILIGDSKRFVYNMIEDILIESDRDIKKNVITYAGYCRGEGTLVDDRSFALITVTNG